MNEDNDFTEEELEPEKLEAEIERLEEQASDIREMIRNYWEEIA